ALRAHISAHLPEYMVPSAFVRLEALPLTVNGKLDRKALAAPDDEAYAHRAYEPPQGEIEITLAQIWAELLDVERVGRHDDFFELGGHSLLAVRLLSRALDAGFKFTAADLFQAPVLKELALKVHLEPQPGSPGVICVRATGSQPPLFFVSTGLGDCSYILNLVEEMDADCPIYGLPWPSFSEVCSPTLEAIASQVIPAIREIRSRGPYRFAGYSSGGILAYAIAEHLLSLNETVSFMAFIDVTLPAMPAGMTPTQTVCEVVLETLEPLEDEHFKLLKRFARHSSIAQLLEKAHQIGAIPPDHNDALMYERIEQFQRALQLYRAPTLPIEVHQFYATDSSVSCRARLDKSSIAPEMSSPMRGWDRVLSAAAIDTTPIPGNHATMMNAPENRKVLARSLSRALNSSPT
ncbi:non-ribosomal peptide synthetase, partial [Bradyrhizobium ottawaense]|uniref:thioesterase domain-containing protein n=1 Tax=Bradyrhizobium ottawaense TaxID=931866 RepID=UPI000BEBCA38